MSRLMSMIMDQCQDDTKRKDIPLENMANQLLDIWMQNQNT